jgi:hypothetical protein
MKGLLESSLAAIDATTDGSSMEASVARIGADGACGVHAHTQEAGAGFSL